MFEKILNRDIDDENPYDALQAKKKFQYEITRANIIRGLSQYDSGELGKNDVWRAKCKLAATLKRDLEFRELLDVQDFFLALYLAFPLMQSNPLSFMHLREEVCTK